MKRLVILAACVFVLSACVGCEAFKLRKDYSKIQEVRTEKGAIATYLEDRLLDFWDMFGFKISMGTGLLVNARATKFLQGGIGFMDGDKFGFKGREVGYWNEWRGEVGASVAYINSSRKNPLIGNKYFFEACRAAETEEVNDIDIFRDSDRDRWDIGVTAHLLFIGFEFEFRLKEFADFLVGLFTLDMCKDDTKNWLRRARATTAAGTVATGAKPPTPFHLTPTRGGY